MLPMRMILATAAALLVADGNPEVLVRRLGAPKFADREAASARIEQIGPEALPALRAARTSSDAEIRARASVLLERIENDLLVKPTLVTLDFRNLPLEQAVAALSERTHLPLQLSPAIGPLRGKRITLVEAERVPAWRAIEELGRAGGVELSGRPGTPVFTGPGARMSPLVLIPTPPGLAPAPTSVSGPFRLSLQNLTHHRERHFGGGNGPVAMGFAPGMGMGRPAAVIGDAAASAETFHANLMIQAEPRVSIALNGPPRLVEATDDLGNSLMPTGSGGPTFLHASGYAGFEMPGGTSAQTSIPLHYPDHPGKVIRHLRGVVPLTVTARKDDPLIIPLAEAKGKTYHGAEVGITIHEVRFEPQLGHTQVELTIQVRGGNDAEPMPNLIANRASGGAGSPLEFVDDQGRPIVQWHANSQMQSGDTVRMTVRILPSNASGPPAEIRYHEMTRVTTEAEFDFQDVPMP